MKYMVLYRYTTEFVVNKIGCLLDEYREGFILLCCSDNECSLLLSRRTFSWPRNTTTHGTSCINMAIEEDA